MNKQMILDRVQASIRPVLDWADELLDYYTDGLPAEVWGPIADSLNPDIGTVWIDIMPDMSKWEEIRAVLYHMPASDHDGFEPSMVIWDEHQPVPPVAVPTLRRPDLW